MKIRHFICSMLTAGLLAGLRVACATEKESQAKLEAKAKVSRVDATAIALAKVPGGTVKEGGIEEENGRLIWSFDIATPGSSDITEVQVDAMTGAVVDIAKETAADQEKEKKEDAKKQRKKDKDDDEKDDKK